MGLTQTRAPVVADAAGLAKVIIGFKQQPGANERALVQGQGGKLKYVYHMIPAIAATIPQQAVDALERNPNVAYVEGDAQAQALQDQLVWGADRIDAEIVWGGTEDAVDIIAGNLTGLGVAVAILDTGIDYTHSDLNDNYVGGYDFVNDDSDPIDDHGHGTHCAGIVAAEDNESGIIQVAPKASLYALKVLDATGAGYYSDIIAALQWCVDNSMQVASMSFGGPADTSLQGACEAAYAANVLLVAAAGNSGLPPGRRAVSTVSAPAMYDSVIAVAATDDTDARASFSSVGPEVELAAPGVGINSTWLGGAYYVASGTSMACPHVSGVAALIIDSGVTGAAAVRNRLATTAENLGDPGRDTYYGYGLVDAEAAAPSGPPPENQPPVADANGPYEGYVDQSITFDGTGSYDPDGDALTYVWDFGDGTVTDPSTEATASHAYPITGEYTVTLTVNDGELEDTGTATANITEAPAELTMHVAAIDMSLLQQGRNWTATALVTILDAGNNAVSGATVYGQWSGAYNEFVSGTTNGNGQGTFTSGKIRGSGLTFTFTVTDVTKDGRLYDPNSNVETSDSITTP